MRMMSCVVTMVAMFGLAGCSGVGTSQLENGGSVEVGRQDFDSYFEEVALLRDEAKEATTDLKEVREPLTILLELDDDAPPGLLFGSARARAEKARGFGLALHLQLTPTIEVVVDSGDSESDADELVAAVRESATNAKKLFDSHHSMLERAAALEDQRGKLAEKLSTVTSTFTRKAEVEAELVGAGNVLAKVESDLLRDTRTIAHLLLGLASAVSTGGAAKRAARCDEAIAFMEENKSDPPPKPTPKARPRPRPRPRPGPRPRPRPRPAPPKPPPAAPAPGGGDFDM